MSGLVLGFFAGFALPVVIFGVPYVIWGPRIVHARPAALRRRDAS